MTVKDFPQNPRPAPRRPTPLSLLLLSCVICGICHGQATAQTAPAVRPAPIDTPAARGAAPFAELRGRTVEDIRIVGNTQTSPSAIRNVIRTRVGEPFEPETVAEDYQRIFQELRSFSNVEAKVEPTARGVIVVFQVTEQRQVREILYVGNTQVDTAAIRQVVDLKVGQSIDGFRIAMARRAIEAFYKDRNFPAAAD